MKKLNLLALKLENLNLGAPWKHFSCIRSDKRAAVPYQALLQTVFNYECPSSHFEDNQPSITSIKNGASPALRYMTKSQRVSIPFLNEVFHDGSNEIDFCRYRK